MKNIYLMIIMGGFWACTPQTKPEHPNSSLSNHSSVSTEIATQKQLPSDHLEIPGLGTFERSEMKLDSLNEYGAGDCWGNISGFSMSNWGLVIDSMFCGEYGFTYTYYLLDKDGSIQMIYIQNSESILNTETNAYFYVQKEEVIDFKTNPALSMKRMDTIGDSTLREQNMDKEFKEEPLKDKQSAYQHYKLEYEQAWKRQTDL